MGAADVNLYENTLSQVESEITGLIDVLYREQVTRFLEIGSRYGGSLWRIANSLPKGSLIVSVDSGKGQGGRKPGAKESLQACVDRLNQNGYRAHLFVGHSQTKEMVAKVKELSPFDAVFIDGDHRLPGLKEDWRNYGPMARLVAFHDIAWVRPNDDATPVDVPILWGELKVKYRHQEFIDKSNGGNMGIGVLWRR